MGMQNQGLGNKVPQSQCAVPPHSRGHLHVQYRIGESENATSETKRRPYLEKRALTSKEHQKIMCTEALCKCNETTFEAAGTAVLCWM